MTNSHAYKPQPVPPQSRRESSIRDDVRRIIFKYRFKPDNTLFTDIQDIYKLFLNDTELADTPQLEARFRSALGRVIRPPHTADAFARSYAANVTRYNRRISLVSEECPSVDPKKENSQYKRLTGQRYREVARNSEIIAKIREDRRLLKGMGKYEQEPPRELNFRYVDEFLTLNCAEDLISMKLFPNGKEMAESMSAFNAVRQYFIKHDKSHEVQDGVLSFKDRNVLLVAVGDGVTPRSAALFAYRTSWKCFSIDPMMRRGPWDDVKNLTAIKSKVEDVNIPVSVRPFERVVVVMWHCHVSIADSLGCLYFNGQKWDTGDNRMSAELRERVAVVTCSCCNYNAVQSTMPDESAPDVEFEDRGVPGLMRTVRVWKFRNVVKK